MIIMPARKDGVRRRGLRKDVQIAVPERRPVRHPVAVRFGIRAAIGESQENLPPEVGRKVVGLSMSRAP